MVAAVLEAAVLVEADFEEEDFVEDQHHSEWVVQDLQEFLLEELEQDE